MNYRNAGQHDMDGINELLVKSFSPTYAYYAKKSFADLQNVVVAEYQGNITGVANWRIFNVKDARLGYLFWLAVDPGYRRQGIAKKLVQEVIREIQQVAGSVEMYAAVEKDNIPSRSLLESSGFSFISRTDMKKKFGPGCLRLYLQMMLLPKEDLLVRYTAH